MLLLKRHLVELVRAGKKRQTLRLWSHALLKTGQVTYCPGLGRLLITELVEIAGLAALSETDALLDGFANKQALVEELTRIYGPPLPATLPPGKRLFRVTFQWPLEEVQTAQTKKSTKAKRSGSQMMTLGQRQAMRAFLLSHKPG